MIMKDMITWQLTSMTSLLPRRDQPSAWHVRNQEDSPTYYLGNSYKRDQNGNLHVSSTNYIKEVLRQFAKKFGEVPKHPIPMREKEHPESAISPHVKDEENA